MFLSIYLSVQEQWETGNFIQQKQRCRRVKYNHHITFSDFFLHAFIRFELLASHFIPSAFQKVRHAASSDICSACIKKPTCFSLSVFVHSIEVTRDQDMRAIFLGSTCVLVASLWLIFSLKGKCWRGTKLSRIKVALLMM